MNELVQLNHLWTVYQEQGYGAIHEIAVTVPRAHAYRALLAFGAEDYAAAVTAMRAAARGQPGSRVYRQAVAYLARVMTGGKAGVYVDGEAFAAFIRGGGNLGLYAAVSAALRTVYAGYDRVTLLDIGVGDGLALLPALTSTVTGLDLVEPSTAMLARTTAALDEWGIAYRAANQTVQAFMASERGASHWDLIQATWSLQSLPPGERPGVFEWLRAHGQRVLIAEFDVPDFPAMFAPARVTYMLDRYEQGLAEYDGDDGLVAQGFLMPVLFGGFDRSTARTNWEGPLDTWVDGLRAAGFTAVDTRHLYAYWWADAYLIDAR